MRGRPGIDQIFARNPEAGAHLRRQRRLMPEDSRPRQQLDIVDAILARLVDQAGQGRFLFLVPRQHQRAAADEGEVQPLVDFQIFGVPGGDAGGFKRPRRRVEARMQYGAVALRGTVENVGRLFQKHDARAFESEAPDDRTADNAAPDNRYVEDFTGLLHALRHCRGVLRFFCHSVGQSPFD